MAECLLPLRSPFGRNFKKQVENIESVCTTIAAKAAAARTLSCLQSPAAFLLCADMELVFMGPQPCSASRGFITWGLSSLGGGESWRWKEVPEQ